MLKNLFSVAFKIFNSVGGKKVFFCVTFCGKEFKLKLGHPVDFPWVREFQEYYKHNDIKNKTKNLKDGLDDISKEYVDYFLRLSRYWDYSLCRNIWTNYDKKLLNEYDKFKEDFEQPAPEFGEMDGFIFFNKYGLKDLPKGIYNNINGKTIIDVGGYNGDTALMFHDNFSDSKIIVFEPLSLNVELMKNILKKYPCDNKINIIHKGLGNKTETKPIVFNASELSDIIPLDDALKDSEESIGLIKIDTEGCEMDIILGAVNTIKKQKPILAIAIYHNPVHFFEMKDLIISINKDYKFMIRRSETILPQTDIVLIAY